MPAKPRERVAARHADISRAIGIVGINVAIGVVNISVTTRIITIEVVINVFIIWRNSIMDISTHLRLMLIILIRALNEVLQLLSLMLPPVLFQHLRVMTCSFCF